RLADRSTVRILGDELWSDGELIATGVRHDLASLDATYEASKHAMGEELERFATNTLEYMQRERHLLLESPDLPEMRTTFDRRHVLVVVRGHDYKNDLAHLRGYVDEMRPVLIGVDGGADALREVGLRPDMIIGDFDSVSEETLRVGAELIVHAYAGGRAPGAERLDALGLEYVLLPSAGTSEDVALLLAFEKGAELIVAVGTHNSMVDFLDKGRAGMASTFLTRLKVGPILLDAKGVSRLYEARIRKRDLTFFLLAAMLCFVVIFLLVTPRVFVEGIWLIIRDLWDSLYR
ncbi:MAG: putative cytokinetic ring protein SteA, partial [Acidimicrobiales bacterium]